MSSEKCHCQLVVDHLFVMIDIGVKKICFFLPTAPSLQPKDISRWKVIRFQTWESFYILRYVEPVGRRHC